jgi:hypothetical protein
MLYATHCVTAAYKPTTWQGGPWGIKKKTPAGKEGAEKRKETCLHFQDMMKLLSLEQVHLFAPLSKVSRQS